MRKIICDRCGAEIKSIDSIVRFDLEFNRSAASQFYRGAVRDFTDGELCADCGKSMCDLMKNDTKAAG